MKDTIFKKITFAAILKIMKLEEQLLKRSENKCELCSAGTPLKRYEVQPQQNNDADDCLMLCDKCRLQIDKKRSVGQRALELPDHEYVE